MEGEKDYMILLNCCCRLFCFVVID